MGRNWAVIHKQLIGLGFEIASIGCVGVGLGLVLRGTVEWYHAVVILAAGALPIAQLAGYRLATLRASLVGKMARFDGLNKCPGCGQILRVQVDVIDPGSLDGGAHVAITLAHLTCDCDGKNGGPDTQPPGPPATVG